VDGNHEFSRIYSYAGSSVQYSHALQMESYEVTLSDVKHYQ